MSSSSRVNVFLTGRLTVQGPDGSFDEEELPGNQARVALAALVNERVPIGRDRLADIIWGEDLPDAWNGSLNALISKIRTLFNQCGLDAKALLTSAGGSYAITLPPGSWVDTEDAVRRLDRAEGAARHGNLARALPDATVASSILRRPFLGGSDGYWIEIVRRRLNVALYQCYELLAEGWCAQGDHRLAIVVAERAISLDPLRETAYRLLMEAELARGDTIAALQVFDRCERVVQSEFGASPSQLTVDVAERARRW